MSEPEEDVARAKAVRALTCPCCRLTHKNAIIFEAHLLAMQALIARAIRMHNYAVSTGGGVVEEAKPK